MQINVQYDHYNTSMVKAEIPINDDSNVSLEIVEIIDEEDNKTQKLVLTSVDEVSNTSIELNMEKSEVRELMSLLNKFLSNMN